VYRAQFLGGGTRRRFFRPAESSKRIIPGIRSMKNIIIYWWKIVKYEKIRAGRDVHYMWLYNKCEAEGERMTMTVCVSYYNRLFGVDKPTRENSPFRISYRVYEKELTGKKKSMPLVNVRQKLIKL